MATKIEWTDETWNPVTGCTKTSPGCQHCYAERMAKRLAGRFGYPADDPFAVTLHGGRLKEPLKWRKPRMVFVCSMGDLFHADVPDWYIDQVFAIMLACHFFENRPDHVFQVLTKRHERMHAYMQARTPAEHLQAWSKAADGWIHMANPDELFSEAVEYDCSARWSRETRLAMTEVTPWSHPENLFPLPNMWLGVSAENQRMADERIPLLLQIPAAVRFVSVEPMLERVDLRRLQSFDTVAKIDALNGTCGLHRPHRGECRRLDWVICGGESGPGARPMNPEWARRLRDQCAEANVPFFFKQWGGVQKGDAGRLLDGCEWNEMPGVRSNGKTGT